jgi:hypothetical protein
VPLTVRMAESVTAGMTRALDSSNIASSSRPWAFVLSHVWRFMMLQGFAMLERMGWKKEVRPPCAPPSSPIHSLRRTGVWVPAFVGQSNL